MGRLTSAQRRLGATERTAPAVAFTTVSVGQRGSGKPSTRAGGAGCCTCGKESVEGAGRCLFTSLRGKTLRLAALCRASPAAPQLVVSPQWKTPCHPCCLPACCTLSRRGGSLREGGRRRHVAGRRHRSTGGSKRPELSKSALSGSEKEQEAQLDTRGRENSDCIAPAPPVCPPPPFRAQATRGFFTRFQSIKIGADFLINVNGVNSDLGRRGSLLAWQWNPEGPKRQPARGWPFICRILLDEPSKPARGHLLLGML